MVQHFGDPIPALGYTVESDELAPSPSRPNDEDNLTTATLLQPRPPIPKLILAHPATDFTLAFEARNKEHFASQLYSALTNRDLDGYGDYSPLWVLEYIKEQKYSPDEAVQRVMEMAIENKVDGAMALENLFDVLKMYAEGDHSVTIVTPNDVPDYVIGLAMNSGRMDMCNIMLRYGLDIRKRWSFGEFVVDMFYWATMCGSRKLCDLLLAAFESSGLRPITGLDVSS